MAKEILLISTQFVKEVTQIQDNLSDKILIPAIREAQEMGLRNIIGYAMLQKLKSLIESGDIGEEGNAKYKELLSFARYYLVYRTLSALPMLASLKIANMGVVRAYDESIQQTTLDENIRLADYFQNKADEYCLHLQRYLCDQANEFPELGESEYNQNKAQLSSSASTGLWLGGIRGKNISR